MLPDAHVPGKYHGMFLVSVCENSELPYIENEDSNENRGARTLPHGTDGNKIEIFPPPRGFCS